LLSIWRIEAPLEEVYSTILDSLRWPEWWSDVQKVEQMAAGGADGIDNVRRYFWKGQLPYRMVVDVRTTRVEHLVAIEGVAQGDLEGIGCWRFSREGAISVVRYEWHVRSNRWWMNLIAPFARSMFIRNHALVMGKGGEELARRLKSRMIKMESVDLMAETAPSFTP